MNKMIKIDTNKDLVVSKRYSHDLNIIRNPNTRRAYSRYVREYLNYLAETGQQFGLVSAEQHLLSVETSLPLRLSAIRWLAKQLHKYKKIDYETYAQIKMIEPVKRKGVRRGVWLTKAQAQKALNKPDDTLKGIRDRAILGVFLGAGLRRAELQSLTFEHIQHLDNRWVIADLLGKGDKLRSVPIASWVKTLIDNWSDISGLTEGIIFRSFRGRGAKEVSNANISTEGLRLISLQYTGVSPHDLRRTFAKLADKGGSHLAQIQITLGHAKLDTTQTYLGTDLDLQEACSDKLGLRI